MSPPPPLLVAATTEVRDSLRALGLPFDGRCAQASVLLALVLGQRGVGAVIDAGGWRAADGWVYKHASVLVGPWRCDATREQFDDGPLVSCDESTYVPLAWSDFGAPPPEPDFVSANAYFDRACGLQRSLRLQLGAWARRLGLDGVCIDV